jgi:hypothetical protein
LTGAQSGSVAAAGEALAGSASPPFLSVETAVARALSAPHKMRAGRQRRFTTVPRLARRQGRLAKGTQVVPAVPGESAPHFCTEW